MGLYGWGFRSVLQISSSGSSGLVVAVVRVLHVLLDHVILFSRYLCVPTASVGLPCLVPAVID